MQLHSSGNIHLSMTDRQDLKDPSCGLSSVFSVGKSWSMMPEKLSAFLPMPFSVPRMVTPLGFISEEEEEPW